VAQISEEKFGLIATSIKNAKTDNFFLVLGGYPSFFCWIILILIL
jgi:hypothetical protein